MGRVPQAQGVEIEVDGHQDGISLLDSLFGVTRSS